MLHYLQQLWETNTLSPHGICLLWRPELIWTHVAADAIIGISYYSIPIALAYFVSRRNDLIYGWVFWAFALFILACGTTHFFSIYTLWVPDYGTEALIKLATAALSIITAIGLWPLLPKALAIPSTEQLHRINAELKQQVDERNTALAALQAEKTARLKTEDMLRQSQKMEALGQITGEIAYDFSNVLTAIAGNLERLEQRFRDQPDIHRSIKAAMQGAIRGGVMTQKLLASGHHKPLKVERTDTKRLIENMGDLLRHTVGERVTVDFSLAYGLWPVNIDRNQLESALLNLAVNARDAMPDGGRLTIESRNIVDPQTQSATLHGAYVLLTVTDTGCGMTPDVASHALHPFYTTKPSGEGSGLGLSQVYGFVTDAKGDIELESQPGKGTSIRIFLPRAEAKAVRAVEDGPPLAGIPLGQAG
jgi:signal transduction histidine kinase